MTTAQTTPSPGSDNAGLTAFAAQLSKSGVPVAGLKFVEVDVFKIRPNPFNPNRQAPEIFEREKRSIKRHGFIDPITVREAADGVIEIVDGEHRWRAARELTSSGEAALGKLPAVHLGRLSDDDAKRLVILFNELRGDPDPAKLALVLKDLTDLATIEELSLDLPMTVSDIESLVKATDFDWGTLEGQESRVHGSKNKDTGLVKFSLGPVKQEMPKQLADAFLAEWEQSTSVVGTRNPEIIMRHFISRLQRVPAAEVAPETLPEKKEPEKLGRKGKKAKKEVAS